MKYTVNPEDQSDHEIGLEIIRVLNLRVKQKNGRIDTTHGDKNPCGLARTVRHLLASPLEMAAPDLLAALEKATARILELVGICEINGLANSFAKADWTAEFFAVISEAKGGQL